MVGEDTPTQFIGYHQTSSETVIIKYRNVKAKGKEAYQWVLASTPFYAESGGQVGDKGSFTFEDGSIIEVTDTKKENNLFIHFTDSLPKTIGTTRRRCSTLTLTSWLLPIATCGISAPKSAVTSSEFSRVISLTIAPL